jgi:hypothetical protein
VTSTAPMLPMAAAGAHAPFASLSGIGTGGTGDSGRTLRYRGDQPRQFELTISGRSGRPLEPRRHAPLLNRTARLTLSMSPKGQPRPAADHTQHPHRTLGATYYLPSAGTNRRQPDLVDRDDPPFVPSLGLAALPVQKKKNDGEAPLFNLISGTPSRMAASGVRSPGLFLRQPLNYF